jgi:hypothetical protein
MKNDITFPNKGVFSMTGKIIHSVIRRNQAEGYILTSLVGFAATVILTRLFLELTGYPQIGNSVLHIAHALWGGLLLIIAAYLPLAYANRWALRAGAVLSGIGIGLFIDEVGKFITQANDYFFPPALPLIYGFILLNVLVYLYFRRPHQENPRHAMYHALEGLQAIMDGDLNAAGGSQIEAHLAIARQSDRDEIVSLANTIGDYLQQEKHHFSSAEPGYWTRITRRMDAFGLRLGRGMHRIIISMLMILWLVLVIGFIAVLIVGIPTLMDQVITWQVPLIVIQIVVGVLMIIALIAWISGNEEYGLKFGVLGFLLSLVALQTIYFYLSQFSAITATLLQLVFLQILLAYRRWYLHN